MDISLLKELLPEFNICGWLRNEAGILLGVNPPLGRTGQCVSVQCKKCLKVWFVDPANISKLCLSDIDGFRFREHECTDNHQ